MLIKVTNTLTGESEVVEADGFDGRTLFRKGGRGMQFTQYPEGFVLEEVAEDDGMA